MKEHISNPNAAPDKIDNLYSNLRLRAPMRIFVHSIVFRYLHRFSPIQSNLLRKRLDLG